MKKEVNKVKLHEKQPKRQQSNKQSFINSSIHNVDGLNKVKMNEKQQKTQQSNETKPKQRQHMQDKQQSTFIVPPSASVHGRGGGRGID